MTDAFQRPPKRENNIKKEPNNCDSCWSLPDLETLKNAHINAAAAAAATEDAPPACLKIVLGNPGDKGCEKTAYWDQSPSKLVGSKLCPDKS